MWFRNTRRLAVLAAVLALSSPFTAQPGAADDTGGISVQITSPDEFTPGEAVTVTVDVHTAAPVQGDDISLFVTLSPRLVVTAVDSPQGFTCGLDQSDPTSSGDVACFGSSFTDTGRVTLTVVAGPGTDTSGQILAQVQSGDALVDTTRDVTVPATPPGFDLTVDAPDRVRTGQEFTVTVTAHTDHPVSGQQVALDLQMWDARLVAKSVSASGFTCVTREREELPGGSANLGGASCTATSLADTVTMAVQVTVLPGAASTGGVQATMTVGNSRVDVPQGIIAFGSDTVSVSGRVWNDLNRNGRQEPGEPGVPHIVVSGQFSFAETEADGRYTLTDLERGETVLHFTAPGRFDFTRANVGDDTHDSDVTRSERDCEDCVIGLVPLKLTGPLSGVDAGIFDPKVAPPTAGPSGTNPPPQGAPRRDLANTGVPVATLVALGIALLAGGVALVVTQQRRRSATDRL